MSAFASSSGHTSARAFSSFVPKAAVSNRSKTVFLLDDLVGGHLHDQRHREAERLRRLEIEHQLEFGRLLNSS